MDNTMETKNTLQAHRSLQSFTRFFYLTVKVYRTWDFKKCHRQTVKIQYHIDAVQI